MKIRICIDDTEVEGEIIRRSTSDITVEITKPYSNLSIGSHIPYFARTHKSFDGEYGDATAVLLLINFYKISKYLDKEMTSIRDKLDSAKDHIINLPVQFNTEDFNVKKRELKQLLKQNKLNSKEYQQQLTPLRKKVAEYHQKVTAIMDDFFEDGFPMWIPHGMRRDVLNAKCS